MRFDDLPRAEFGFPGALRDQLVAAILEGKKTASTGLATDYEAGGDPLPQPGLREAVVDSAGEVVAVIEYTAIDMCRLGEIDLRHALDEGEGYESVAQWREAHERFWHSQEMRDHLGDPDFTVDDDTLVLKERFRVVERTGGRFSA
jgi:uncharacterized protein YhfF